MRVRRLERKRWRPPATAQSVRPGAAQFCRSVTPSIDLTLIKREDPQLSQQGLVQLHKFKRATRGHGLAPAMLATGPQSDSCQGKRARAASRHSVFAHLDLPDTQSSSAPLLLLKRGIPARAHPSPSWHSSPRAFPTCRPSDAGPDITKVLPARQWVLVLEKEGGKPLTWAHLHPLITPLAVQARPGAVPVPDKDTFAYHTAGQVRGCQGGRAEWPPHHRRCAVRRAAGSSTSGLAASPRLPSLICLQGG